jgi:hypothetical protein
MALSIQALRMKCRHTDFQLGLAALICLINSAFTLAVPAAEPRVFLLNGPRIEETRQRIANGESELKPPLAQLRHNAEQLLHAGPYSVVNKKATPPSGDKHDYMSRAPYWWPNPNTSDGLPYVRRDGERNPGTHESPNRGDLGKLTDTVETLSLAYYFTHEETFANRAALLIRAWFIDPQTRMNPNFQFAQAIRGVNTGRGLGLIESRLFTKIVDSVGLLTESRAWSDGDQRAIEHWFAEYLDWMLTSENGRAESRAQNNHGTYYDVQVASFALFLGKKEIAIEVLESAKTKRIALQIEPDGRQPLELVRTKAWGYSLGNLSGLMSLACLGEHVDVDLWNYQTSDGRSIRRAIDFLLPFGVNGEKWPYQQIDGFSATAIQPILRRCAEKYADGQYAALLSKLQPLNETSRIRLLEPATN